MAIKLMIFRLLSIASFYGFGSSRIYDKRNDVDFDIVNFRFSMVTFLAVLLMVYTFRNHDDADFKARNKCLTAKLLQQGYRYHKLRNTFS